MINEGNNMQLDQAILEHVTKMPAYLQTEVYDFILFLEHKQGLTNIQKPSIAINNELIKLTLEEQQNFVESVLNPKPPNDKLQKLAKKIERQSVLFTDANH